MTRPLTETSNRHKSDPQFQRLGLNALTDEYKETFKEVEEISKKHGLSQAIICTAWVLSKGNYPIFGLNSVQRVEEAVKASFFTLSNEKIEYLEESYRPKKVVGFVQ